MRISDWSSDVCSSDLMTPASYAKGGKGAVIVYDIVDSPLGRLLVAATAKGLCFLSLGHHDRTLIQELKREFPQAESITRDQHSIAQSVRSEEHTSELQSLMRISYAVFCLKKKKKNQIHITNNYTDT